ncbi:MAG: hypothetical protein R3194_07620 [Limnobacter sp.]|nr:hypothetical protein [Limnobacter sp.]
MIRVHVAITAVLFLVFAGFSPDSVWAQTTGQAPAAFEKALKPAESAKPQEEGPKPVGEIKAITGVASLTSAKGESRFASEGSKLYVGDVVSTQKSSSAVLKFIDQTQVALRHLSRFVV